MWFLFFVLIFIYLIYLEIYYFSNNNRRNIISIHVFHYLYRRQMLFIKSSRYYNIYLSCAFFKRIYENLITTKLLIYIRYEHHVRRVAKWILVTRPLENVQ